jgi:16S rRNA G966 N2-methylase RsmD
VELGLELEKIEVERARRRQESTYPKEGQKGFQPAVLASRDANIDDNAGKPGRTAEKIANKVGISRSTYLRAKKIKKYISEETRQKLRSGKGSITKEYWKARKEEKRQKLITEPPTIDLPQNIELHHADFVTYCEDNIPTNSIDLIYTDPPYGEEAVHYYHDLAMVAIRLLKNGGNLVTFTGQYMLPEVIRALSSTGLRYFWTFAVIHSGNTQAIHPRKILCNWKPMLWFVKGEQSNALEYIDDHIVSDAPNKVEHKWAQSVKEAEHVIKRLTTGGNQIVLDPMMGSGTMGMAALKLGRKFIEIDIEKESFETASYCKLIEREGKDVF